MLSQSPEERQGLGLPAKSEASWEEWLSNSTLGEEEAGTDVIRWFGGM